MYLFIQCMQSNNQYHLNAKFSNTMEILHLTQSSEKIYQLASLKPRTENSTTSTVSVVPHLTSYKYINAIISTDITFYIFMVTSIEPHVN